jgi:preprotein translocase subunit YajC
MIISVRTNIKEHADMFISAAYAASEATAGTSPQAWEAFAWNFAWNMGLVLVLVVLFYVLLIMPQQRRFKEHRAMLDALKKGDEVITGGGLVGKVDKIINDNEVVVDLGNNMKVTAVRSTLQTKTGLLSPELAKPEDKNKKEETKKKSR